MPGTLQKIRRTDRIAEWARMNQRMSRMDGFAKPMLESDHVVDALAARIEPLPTDEHREAFDAMLDDVTDEQMDLSRPDRFEQE